MSARISLAAVVFVLAPSMALTHPPYEHEVGRIGDLEATHRTLAKSYIDGLIFTDPVKLVVRDESGATIAETEYGRDVAIVCWLRDRCVVFWYDGFLPVEPRQVWQLRMSGLTRTDSELLRVDWI